MKKKKSAFEYFMKSQPLRWLIVLEIVIMLLFIVVLVELRPLSSYQLKETTIQIEQVEHIRYKNGRDLAICDDGVWYYFTNNGGGSDYSLNELRRIFHSGYELHLTYYTDSWRVVSQRNVIVEAHTDTEVLRTIEGYNATKWGLRPTMVVLFILVELLYGWGVFTFFWRNRHIFRHGKKKKKKQKKG